MHDTKPENLDAPLTLNLGGSDIGTKTVANKAGQYFDYGLMLFHSPGIVHNARP